MNGKHVYRDEITHLQELLQERADPKVRDWWDNYVKGSAPFRGVKMPVIRSLLHKWHKAHIVLTLETAQQVELALALFHEAYSEDKIAGTQIDCRSGAQAETGEEGRLDHCPTIWISSE